MMLDALSKAAAEPAVKGSGRSGKADDGEAGFSSALTRLSGRNAGEGKAQAGPGVEGEPQVGDTSDHVDMDAVRTPSGPGRMGKIAITARHGLAESPSPRPSISQTGLGARKADTNGIIEAKNDTSMAVAGEDTADRAGASGDDDPAAPEPKSAPDSGDGQGASELLGILAGPAQVWSALGAGGNPAIGEGHKSDAMMKRGEADAGNLRRNPGLQSEHMEMPTMELDSAVQPARSFRFSDTKGGDVAAELTRAANLQEKTGDNKRNAASIENIAVVESRRFLGLAPSSNSASLLASMIGDTGWSSAMQSGEIGADRLAGGATGSAVQMLKLQMNPHDLGTVTATLRLIGEELHVHLTVETRAAYRQLSEDSKGMLDALKSHGFSVDQLTINIAATAESDQHKGQQNAATGQQMTGNGERNGSAQNREQQRPGFDAEMNGRADGNDLGTDKAASADPLGTRSGQLYL